MAADVAFTFDPRPILGGVDTINRRMSDMTKSFSQGAKDLTKSVTRGILKATALVGGLVAVFKSARSAISANIPEIGQAFKIVKEIFFKQFFFPLRKELMPLLQRVLDWTRDNRAMFLKWGQTVVNIFKTVITIAKQMVQWARTMFEQITTAFGRLFGDQVSSLQEALDLLAFKASAVAIFLGLMAQQVIDWFSEIVEKWGSPLIDLFQGLVLQSGLISAAWELLKSAIDGIIAIGGGFLDGLAERAADVGENLVGIFQNIQAIWEAWTTPTISGNSLVTVARTLGGLLSDIFEKVTSIVEAFTGGFAIGASDLMDSMQAVADSFREIWNLVFGGEGLEHFFMNLGQWVGEALTGGFQILADVLDSIADAIRMIKQFLSGEHKLKLSLEGIGGLFQDAAGQGGRLFETGFVRKVLDFLSTGLPVGEVRSPAIGELPQIPELTQLRQAAGGGVSPIVINLNGMTLNVTEGNAEAAGANFGTGLATGVRDQIDADRRAAGQ